MLEGKKKLNNAEISAHIEKPPKYYRSTEATTGDVL